MHFKLFDSLRDKQRTSTAEFVSFSYLASLDLFLNAHQQEDYENCVNMDVIEQPSQWVTEFVTELVDQLFSPVVTQLALCDPAWLVAAQSGR